MTADRALESGEAEAAKRLAVLRRHLDGDVPLTRAAADAGVPLRTVRRWRAKYRTNGPSGLARLQRTDSGTRKIVSELVESIEGMALTKPRVVGSDDPSSRRLRGAQTGMAGSVL